MKLKTVFYISIIFTLIALASSTTVYAQTMTCTGNIPLSISISSRYSTPNNRCTSRYVSASVYYKDNTTVEVEVTVEGVRYYLTFPWVTTFYFDVVKTSNDPNSGMVILLPGNFVVCETIFCELSVSCSGHLYGSLNLMPPACEGSGGDSGDSVGGGGGGCSCEWWNIPCHFRCIVSWMVNQIRNELREFWEWLKNAISSAVPEWLRDITMFLPTLTAIIVSILPELVRYAPYFASTLLLFFMFGLVYYVVEYGIVGVAKYFEMLYDLFKKFVELVIKIIDFFVPLN